MICNIIIWIKNYVLYNDNITKIKGRILVKVKEEEKAPETVFKEEIERLMKKTLKMINDSDHWVYLINKLEEIREYLDGNSTRD